MIDKVNGITLEQLAEECGVSVATMHRYLKRPHLLKDSMRQDIQKQLQQNETFNISLITPTLDGIALFIPDHALLITTDIIRIIQAILHRHHMHIIIIDAHSEMELHTALMKNKKILNTINGVIAYSFDTYKDYSSISKKYNIPIVCINSRGNKIGVSFNNRDYQVGQDAATYLIQKGYKKIAFVGWDLEDKHVYDRYIGWKQTCEKNNVIYEHILSPPTLEGGYVACRELIETITPDAIFFACDAMALGGLEYLGTSKIILGEQLGILGFDNILAGTFVGLSTMEQFIEEKIIQAVEYILQYNSQLKCCFEFQETLYTSQIIERKTTIRKNR